MSSPQVTFYTCQLSPLYLTPQCSACATEILTTATALDTPQIFEHSANV